MPDTPTAGTIAYAAYWQVHTHDGHIHIPPPFAQLPAITRASWEAAAQAVLHQVTQRWTAEDIVQQINAREAASLEALRREAEDTP